MTNALLPDTNVFLHYKPVTDIDWPALASDTAIKVVVCLQVIKELDEKKDHPDLGDRARRAIREIRAIRSAGGIVRDGVTLEVFNEEIRLDLLPTHMSPDSADDRIVYQAKQYAQSHPGIDVSVVSEDLGMELRCHASGVRAFPPDLKDRLPNPESELKKQNRQLTNELATLLNRLPKLVLRATGGIDGEDPFTLGLCQPKPLDPAVETEIARRAHPPLQPPHHAHSYDAYPMGASLDMNEISPHEYTRYNGELEEYFEAYRAHVPHRSAYIEARARSFPFELILENDGTCPAEDIDVYVHIPNEAIESVTKDDDNDLRIPPFPTLPEKPASTLSRMLRTPSLADMQLRHLDNFRPPIKHDGVQRSRIEATNGEFTIRVNVGRLKHKFTISLGKFRARFRSWESVRPIQARCSMTAGNHPRDMEQQLVLRVRRKD